MPHQQIASLHALRTFFFFFFVILLQMCFKIFHFLCMYSWPPDLVVYDGMTAGH